MQVTFNLGPQSLYENRWRKGKYTPSNGFHYSCVVTAPDLRGAIFTNFLLDPLLIDRKDKTEDFIELDAIADRLATLEDTVN
jgi:hypothetical protein